LGPSWFESQILVQPLGKVLFRDFSIVVRDPIKSPQNGQLHDAGRSPKQKPPVFVSTLTPTSNGLAWLPA
jgi:hypothetical protein